MHIIAFIVEGLYHLLFTLLHQFMPTLMMYAGIKKQRLTRYILNEMPVYPHLLVPQDVQIRHPS